MTIVDEEYVVHEDQGDYDGRYTSNNVSSFRYSTSNYTRGYSYCGLNQPYAADPSSAKMNPHPLII